MTRDDINKMIQECGFSGITENDYLHFWKFYKKAYEAGAKAEREACANVCEKGVDTEHPTVKGHVMKWFGRSELLAAAIRARGVE